MACVCLAVVFLLLYIAFDINYFIRVAFLVGLGPFFKKKVNILDTTTIFGWCTTQDLDIFMRHMNNSRYMRDLDFARFDFYVLSGLYEQMKKSDGHALQGASTIRYRRPIQTFSFYKIETKVFTPRRIDRVTKGCTHPQPNVSGQQTTETENLAKRLAVLIYWEEKAIYLEHRFVTLDNFVRAIVISKQNTINFNPVESIKVLAKEKYEEPKMPEELSQWLNSVETLSVKLRKSD